MKFDGKNIIKDTDITLTNGKTLNSELMSFQNDIDLLKSNVKFIYKHGTLGGGNYTGPGESTNKKLKVVFYMQQSNGLVSIDNNDEVFFSGPGNYNIKLKLYGVTENSRYNVDIIYEQGTHLNVTLTSSNNYTYTGSLKLSSNDNIKIDLDADGYLYDGIFKCKYVTSIYNITSPKIIRGYKQSNDDVFDINQDKVDQNGLIFMNNYTNTGIVMGFYCNFVIPPSDESSIIFTDWLDNKYNVKLKDLGIKTDISSSKTLFFNLTGDEPLSQIDNNNNKINKVDIKEFLSNSNYAKTYEFKVEFDIRLIDKKGKEHIINDKYVVKNNLIPSSLFLMVESNKGKLFNIGDLENISDPEKVKELYKKVMACSPDEKFLLGSTTLYVTPFHGYRDDNRTYNLSAKIFYRYNEGTGDFEESKQISINNTENLTVKDQNRIGISVPLLYSGFYKIEFALKENNNDTYYGIYFLNVSNIESDFNWFNEAKQYQISNNGKSHASFKQNYEVKDSDNINVYYNNISPENKLNSLSSIIMSTNDQPKLYKFDIEKDQSGIFDQLLEISIQYSKTNDTSIPIFSLNRKSSKENSNSNSIEPYSLFVFQDKIVCTNEIATITEGKVNIDEISQKDQAYIYIPISETINYNDKSMYSLLTIYKNMEGLEENNNPKYGIYTLINGIYDGILRTFDYNYGLFDSITFYPGNYAINLIETICLPHYGNDLDNENNYYTYTSQDGFTTKQLKYMNQYDFENYFYSYETLYRNVGVTIISQHEQNLIKYFSEFTYDEKLQMVRCNVDSAKNIASNIDIPVLLLSFMNPVDGKEVNGNANGLEGWLGKSYGQDDYIGKNIPVQIWWSSSKTSGLQLVNNVVTIGGSDEGSDSSIPEFSFNIQGSSTKGYHCKNIELYGPTSSDDIKYLYSPNITHEENENSEAFKEMLLPEESFTLKADVVDSSHSNNNAIGAFINDNLSEFSTARNIFEKQEISSKYIKKIKKCLTGFPILVFLNTTYKLGENSPENNCYYLGIYNFNLGRNSHFNLGYNNLKPIVEAIEKNQGANGFVIYKFKNISMPIYSGLFVSEIQYNDKFFDFSQYHESILYQLPDNPNDNLYMWGDFVYGTNLSDQRSCLSLLMEKVSWTGGYIFHEIGKGFSDDPGTLYGYNSWYSPTDSEGNPIENVPNFRHQLKRTFDNENKYEEHKLLPEFSDFKDQLQATFANTLSTTPDGDGNPNVPILDYRSVSEYYTTCMAFGMVDSVEKNLNIKSWTTKNEEQPGTFYTAFYDMDTALGITNQGSRMTYFAFSDYWQSKIDENNTLQQVNIIRDWVTPSLHDGEEVKFFDVPSSYLFAIAKYAPMIQKSNWDSDYISFQDHPSSIWARWRRKNGCLRNAKHFVDTYFGNHLSKVPISAINWNYKYKYLIKDSSNNSFDDVNFIKFYGTKRAYTENWLSNRLHIMDAYMNISGINQKIGNYYILGPNSGDVDQENTDILLFREIFRNPGVDERLRFSKPGTFTFGVKSIPYSPLIIQIDNTKSFIYLSPPNNEQYYLTVEGGYGGEPYISYYGSTNWYFLSDINKFISDSHSLTVNSDYFTELNGSGGNDTTSCTNWNLTTPAIKNISLTNKLYGGNLIFDENESSKYPNLNKVNISNSSINFTTNGTNLSTLIANNMQGSTIKCTNVNKLSNVSLSGKFGNIVIEAWSENIHLPAEGYGNIDCPNIKITNKRFNTVNVYINNNATLTDITLENCTSLSLINCPKVQEIIINNDTDTGKPQFKSFIFDAQDINKVETGFKLSNGANIKNTKPGVVDLSFCNQLESLSIRNSYTTKVILPNDENIHISLPEYAFANNLYDFIGFSGNASLYITGQSTFQNCPQLNLFQVNDNVRDANGLYTSEINNDVIEGSPLNLYIDSTCTSLASTFACNSKHTGKIMTFDQAKSFLAKCTYNCVSQVTDISSMFEYQTKIIYNGNDALHEYQSGKCSLSFENFRKCSNFDNVFKNTGLEFINRYMFGGNFARDVDSLKYNSVVTNISYGNQIYTTVDFLYEIIDKLTSIFIDSTLTIVDPYNEKCTPIERDTIILGKIFNPTDSKTQNIDSIKHPKLLTKITKFNISNTCPYDFNGLFNEEENDQVNIYWEKANENGLELDNFLSTGTYKVYRMDECGLGNIFKNIKLKKIENVLNNIIGISTDDRVDISDFMDYENGISLLTNICYNISSGYPSLQFAKKVSYSRFKEICDCLFGFNINSKNTQLESISYLFNDLQIEEDESNKIGDHLILVTDTSLKERKQNTNITNISYLFSKLSIKTLDGNVTSVPLTWETLYCLPMLTKVENTFSNILLRYPISFDFFHKRTLDNTKFESVVVEGNKTAKLYRYKYRHEITNMNYCFANCLLEEAQPFKGDSIYNKDINGNSIINRNYIIDGDKNLYNEYYNNGEYNPIPQPVEITDFEIAEQPNYTTYHEQFLSIGNGKFLTNGKNYGYNKDGSSGVFVAPDIFYGCRADSKLYKVFENRNDDNAPCFTGTLPLHLLHRDENNDELELRNNSSFENSLYNLNILPIKFYQEQIQEDENNSDSICTHTYYYFIPKEFILSTNLSYTFTFKLLLPYQSKELKEHFFIFMNNSINTEINTLWEAIPRFLSSNEQIGKKDGDYLIDNWYQYDINRLPIYINIFGNAPLDKNNKDLVIKEYKDIKEGLDMLIYTNLKLDSIFKSEWLNIYYGNVFKDGSMDVSKWKSSYLQQNNTYALNGSFIGLSYYANIFLPAKNTNYFSITVENYGINERSIINPDIINDETFKQSQERDSNYQNIRFKPDNNPNINKKEEA